MTEALRAGAETFHALRGILKQRGLSTGVGDEGGFAPDVATARQALDLIVEAIGKAGYKAGKDVFITLDPERDTPEVLAQYVPGFDPTFIALRGTRDETAAIAKDFKVFYQKVPGKTETSYTLDHTAGSYVFDREGRIRLFVRHAGGVDPIVADLKKLMR